MYSKEASGINVDSHHIFTHITHEYNNIPSLRNPTCKQALLPDTEASFLWPRNLEKLHQRNRFAIVYVGIRVISDLQTS